MTQNAPPTGQTYNNPLWPGPRLLVPISIECLLIGQPNQLGSWARMEIDYQALSDANDPEPLPFSESGDPPETGAHLQVTLPAAFRNGAQQPDGSVLFPPIPNRWLILRSLTKTPGDAPVITATVLQGDFLGNSTEGSNSYPDPANPGQTLWLGKAFGIAEWTNPDGPEKPVLLSMGPGSVAWVATYSNTLNVLSFHDPLTGIGSGDISYAVLGWYAPSQFDPVLGITDTDPDGFTNSEDWQTMLDALKFTVGGAAGLADAQHAWTDWLTANPITNPKPLPAIQTSLAGQSLCHGMVMGIDWQGPKKRYPRAPILDGENPLAVAVGGTGYEAIAAWLAKALTQPDLEDLLLAVQQDLAFDYLKDPSVFAAQSQAARFANLDSGTTWLVAPPAIGNAQADSRSAAAANGDAKRGTALQNVPLSEPQSSALTALNDAQGALDRTAALIAGNIDEAFALVFKLIKTPENPFGGNAERRKQIIEAIAASKSTLSDLNSTLQSRQATLEDAKASLTALLGNAYVLTSNTPPRFRHPVSPTVMIAGAVQDTRFLPPGDDGSTATTLFCRFTGQMVRSLTVLVPGVGTPQILTVGDLATRIAFPPIVAGIPKELADYLVEMTLLDIANARFLAMIAYSKAGIDTPTPQQLDVLAATIARQQTAPWSASCDTHYDEQTAAEAVGIGGSVPIKRAVLLWTPPWTPLFVDWKMTWHPSANDAAGMLGDWTLQALEYKWTGKAIGAPQDVISGRTVLGTQIAAGLSDKLGKLVLEDPNFQSLPCFLQRDLRKALAEIGQFDLVTCNLPDFGNAMLMQRSQMTQLIDPDETGLQTWLKDANQLVPLPGSGQGTEPGFYPLHAGHFVLNQLWIVDAFGQILRTTNAGQDVLPIRSKSVTTADLSGADNAYFVQVAPGISQGSRSLLRLLDACDDAIATNSSDRTNPVAGWLLPNHLDNSVLVFDQAGTPLGELLTVVTDNGRGIRWDPKPGLNLPLGSAPAIGNLHLLGFVQGLLAQVPISGDEALSDLLDVIDVTLWARPGSVQPANNNLAVLIGQPVAVVRADLGLDLLGTPAWNQSWADTGKRNDGGAMDVPYKAFVGNIDFSGNGVLGYFLDDDYSLLNPLRGFSTAFGSVRRAVAAQTTTAEPSQTTQMRLAQALDQMPARLDAGAQATSGYLASDPFVTLKPNGARAKLTVLMDPRGAILTMDGIHPMDTVSLPLSSVAAMDQLMATFRIGPILADPRTVQMPLPGNVAGNWSWIARAGVSTWETQQNLQPAHPGALLPGTPPSLREGWLGLVPKRPVGGPAATDGPSTEMEFLERTPDR